MIVIPVRLWHHRFVQFKRQPQSHTSGSNGNTDLNYHNGWKYSVNVGPHFIGTNDVIRGFGEADKAMTFISAYASHNDLSVAIRSPEDLFNHTPRIPYSWMQGYNTAGDIFEFSAFSAFNGYPIEKFDQPVTVIVPYDTKKVSTSLLKKLQILAHNTKTKKWTPLTYHGLDTKQGFVAATTDSFSYFVVGYKK